MIFSSFSIIRPASFLCPPISICVKYLFFFSKYFFHTSKNSFFFFSLYIIFLSFSFVNIINHFILLYASCNKINKSCSQITKPPKRRCYYFSILFSKIIFPGKISGPSLIPDPDTAFIIIEAFFLLGKFFAINYIMNFSVILSFLSL